MVGCTSSDTGNNVCAWILDWSACWRNERGYTSECGTLSSEVVSHNVFSDGVTYVVATVKKAKEEWALFRGVKHPDKRPKGPCERFVESKHRCWWKPCPPSCVESQ